MAQKFHVSKDGIARLCTAKGPCPLGGNDLHFDTKQEAQDYADSKAKKEFGLLRDKANFYSKDDFENKASELATETISHYPKIDIFKPRAQLLDGTMYIRIPVESMRHPTENDWNFFREYDGSLSSFDTPHMRDIVGEAANKHKINIDNIEKNVDLMKLPKEKSIKYDTTLEGSHATLDIYITLEYDKDMERTDTSLKSIISEVTKRL